MNTSTLLAALAALAMWGCAHGGTTVVVSPPKGEAVAHLHPTQGNAVLGNAVFTDEGNNVTLKLTLSNALPGVYAVHLHENGDCSAPDASSAGAHWNPTGSSHGRHGQGEYHLGDVANLTVGDNGEGTISISTQAWSIGSKGTDDIVGKSVIVHSGKDDFQSQPAGNAGSRIACGVVTTASAAAAADKH